MRPLCPRRYATEEDRCVSRIRIYDDRWGAFVDRCESTRDHDGDHYVTMDACEPVGYLIWSTDELVTVNGEE